MNSLSIGIQKFVNVNQPNPCLLLVHGQIEHLRVAMDELVTIYDWPCLSIGSELSEALLAVEPKRRYHGATRWLEARLRDFRPGPLLCIDIDLLFEPTLQLDPPAFFRAAGRNTQLVTLWPGTYQNGVLAYAAPGHAHYRTWHNPQLSIVVLG